MNKSEKENRNKNMIIAILGGMTFAQAAKKHGLNSRQAAEWIFKADVLTPVKFFLSQELEEIKENGNDITAMRKQWAKRMDVFK